MEPEPRDRTFGGTVSNAPDVEDLNEAIDQHERNFWNHCANGRYNNADLCAFEMMVDTVRAIADGMDDAQDAAARVMRVLHHTPGDPR